MHFWYEPSMQLLSLLQKQQVDKHEAPQNHGIIRPPGLGFGSMSG